MRLVVLVALLAGCSLDRAGRAAEVDPGPDAVVDAGAPDTGRSDGGSSDGGPSDAGPPDGGPPDAYVPPVLCPPDPDLVACWPLDGDGVDHGTRANDLAVASVTWEPGGGVRLDASSGLVRTARPELRHTHLSVDAWVRVDAFPAPGARAGVVDHDGQLGIFVGPDGELRCAAAIVGGTVVSVPGVLVAGTWHHVACIGDGANAVLYVDGSARGSIAASATGTAADTPLHLGENAPDGLDQLLGALDDVRLWDRPRTADDVEKDVVRGRVVVP